MLQTKHQMKLWWNKQLQDENTWVSIHKGLMSHVLKDFTPAVPSPISNPKLSIIGWK
jgi:hypothetical protein